MFNARRVPAVSLVLALVVGATFAPSVAAAAPSNDSFASATLATPLPFAASADTTDATLQGSEDQPFCGPVTNTVWFQFTSLTTRTIRATSAGSNFDTVISIWDGASLGSLTEVTCGDDVKNIQGAVPNRTSRVTWRAIAGVTYSIQVGGFDGAFGDLAFQLRQVTAPLNDDFANARNVTAPINVRARTASASTQPGEAAIQGNQCSIGRASVWYHLTSPIDTVASVDTLGAKIDTVIGVYTGSSLASLEQVACGNDTVVRGTLRDTSRVAWKMLAATDYYVQVMGFYGQTSTSIPVHFRRPTPIANDNFGNATVVSPALPSTRPVNLLRATVEAGEPGTLCASDDWQSAWYAYTAPADTTLKATIGVTDDDFTPTLAVYTGPDLLNLSEGACVTNQPFNDTPSESLTFAVSSTVTYYLRVATNIAASGPVSLTLEAVDAAAAVLEIDPTSKAFGSLATGSASAGETFTVTNTGGSSSGTLQSFLSGTNPGQFHMSADTCDGVTLAPAATCTVQVAFQPTATGAKTASLKVSGAPGGTATASLTGTGLAPAQISITPASLAYGSVVPGGTPEAFTFTVTNTGGVSTSALALGLSGTDSSQFQNNVVDDLCTGQVLAPSGSCTVVIEFDPTSVGLKLASLDVSATTGGSDSSALAGLGVAAAELSIIPSIYQFGAVTVGFISTFTFTISNIGDVPTGALNVALSGTNQDQYEVFSGLDQCTGEVLSASESCQVTVQFAPTSAGPKVATLGASASPGGLASATLAGSGVEP